MGKPKQSKISRETIAGIFQHFGTQEQGVRKAFLNGANLQASHAKDAARSGVLPVQGTWKKIQTSAIANGWTPPKA